MPKISMDYFFMSQEDEKASENPLFLMADETGGNRYMRAVGPKIIMRWTGLSRILMKSSNLGAIREEIEKSSSSKVTAKGL